MPSFMILLIYMIFPGLIRSNQIRSNHCLIVSNLEAPLDVF